MPRRRSQDAAKREALIQKALAGLADGTYKSPYQAADALQISRSTLNDRLNGKKTRAEARANQQLLSPAEEKALVKWVKQLTIAGYPARHSILREMAEEVRAQRVASINDSSMQLVFYRPIGQSWVQRFLLRHPELKSVTGRQIDASRFKETTKPVIENWFEVITSLMKEYGIRREDVYNMDESGYGIGTHESSRVIIDSSLRTRYQAQPGRQEWVSTVECICADGTSIPPLIIFKGAYLLSNWIPNELDDDCEFSCSFTGWTSNVHGLEWLRKCFQPATKDKADGHMRLLICDGHDSHISGNFIGYCIQHNILLAVLPPHTSHILQPLDVALFGPMKKALSSCLDRLTRTEVSWIQKVEWMRMYIKAHTIAFTEANIKAGWRGAGLFPLNRLKVLHHVPRISTPSSSPIQETRTPFDNQLITSSPPDATLLHSTNTALNELLATREPLTTPARKYVARLSETTERLRAQVSILQREKEDLKQVVKARRDTKKGKRIALKGQILVSTRELHRAVVAAEKATCEKSKKKHWKKYQDSSSEPEIISESEQELQESQHDEIGDCIVVEYC